MAVRYQGNPNPAQLRTYENAMAASQAEAVSHLVACGYEVFQRAATLLGYAAVGSTAGILLATRLRKKAELPGGHAVYLVTESQWVLVSLQVNRQPVEQLLLQ